MPRDKKKCWEFKAKSASVGELFLYGEIASYSWYGDEVTPMLFKEELDALGDIDTLNVYINSGGGDVFAGWSMINMLARHRARKVGYNDGLAASIAFDILMSMDEVVAMENSMLMTHNCWTFACGNRHELREQAQMMEKIDMMLAETSSRRSGKAKDEILAMQDTETWWTAREALADGFVDRVENGAKLAACIEGGFFVAGNEKFDLSRYRRPPVALAGAEPETDVARAPKPPGQHTAAITWHSMPPEERGPGGFALPDEPYNGGESQPVKDTDREKRERGAQRALRDRIRRKINGGCGHGENL